MNYNESQQKAIAHREGPMLVLAGPGSGKTAVITRRVLELTKSGVAPGNILVITFTKAAAIEMQERFERLQKEEEIPLPQGRVNFGTFHAVFFKIIKYAYHLDASNIIKEEISHQLLSEIIEKLNIEIEDKKEFIEGIRSEISKIKSERIDIKNYYSMNCPEEQFQQIFLAYTNAMKEQRLIDFDDILLYCYDLLVKRADILAMWQEKYQYILIDEFQDINRIQYDIIRMLAKPQDNLFIVGDDDQSIYQFRGAKPEIMLNFANDYPNTKQVLLNYNYRSQEEIVKTSLRLISYNKNRFPKEILATKPKGMPIKVEKFATQDEEGERIVQLIREYKSSSIEYNDIAILFRTNTQARTVMGKLLSYNIPFQMRDVVPNLFDHWIAKNIMAYMRLALGSRERGLMLQIMNRPNRYLARDVLKTSQVNFYQWKKAYKNKNWMIERIDKLEHDLNYMASLTPYAMIQYIRKAIGYESYLEEYAQYRRMNVEDLIETITDLQESTKGFQTVQEWFDYIEQYKKELEHQKEQKEQRHIDGVMLATMHSSKGLEYEVVMLPDVNEGITPYKKAVLDEELEEERRMYYVAMTRAKKYLHIFSILRLHGKGIEPSRFLGEMQLGEKGIKAGTKVVHVKFGKGMVVSQEKGQIRIYFEALKAERVLQLKMCKKNNLLKVVE